MHSDAEGVFQGNLWAQLVGIRLSHSRRVGLWVHVRGITTRGSLILGGKENITLVTTKMTGTLAPGFPRRTYLAVGNLSILIPNVIHHIFVRITLPFSVRFEHIGI